MTPTTSDRVCETTATAGTGSFALAGAVAGYRTFLSAIGNGVACYYCAEAVDATGAPSGDWEVGTGTLSGGSTLSRSSVLASSNGGGAVNFAAGTKRVFAALPLELLTRFALVDSANTFTASQTVQGTVTATGYFGSGTDLTGVAVLGSDNAFTGNQSVTGAVSATTTLSVAAGGKTLTTSGTTTWTSNDTELVLACTGDSLGTTELHMRNRSGQAGPLFKNLGFDTLDFAFQTQTSAVRSVRLENRSSATFIGTPELQFGVQDHPRFVIADSACGVFEHANATPVTFYWRNASDTTFNRTQADVTATWATATDASRKARLVVTVYDATAGREVMRGESNGSAPMISFLGAAAVVQQANASQTNITAVADANAKAALQAIYNLLKNYGLAPATA